MNRRQAPRQPSLFENVVQPRYVEPEPTHVYAAVLKLRRSGLKVFRLGLRHHKIGKPTTRHATKVTTRELLEIAEHAMGWNPNR